IVALRSDRSGSVWATTSGAGLVRIEEPDAEHPRVATYGEAAGIPAVYLSGLVADEKGRLYVGTSHELLRFDPAAPAVVHYGAGDAGLRQRLLGGADGAWSAPNAVRSVLYATLGPARYRFLLRAVNARGAVSPSPASVTFTIPPPIWRRWWFLLSAAALIAVV